MKKYPLVSVILPSYNRAWTLKDAVDSVLLQDYPNIELIIIDDGSDDDTQELLGVYKNKITVLCQENKGVSAARNKGIKASRGKFIALLDSDDAWDKRKISCQMEFFNDHPEALICQTEEIWIRNGKKVNPKVKHKKPSGMIFEQSLHLCLVSPSSVMMKRQLFDMKGYFNETFLVCEDYDLWLRIAIRYPFKFLSDKLIVKRGGHEDQLSRKYWGMDRWRVYALEKILRSDDLNPERRGWVTEMLIEKSGVLIQGFAKRGKNEEAEVYRNLVATYS